MRESVKSFLIGAGSILELCPHPIPSRIRIPLAKYRTRKAKSGNDAIRYAWERVGDAIWDAAEIKSGVKVSRSQRFAARLPRNIKEGRIIKFRSKPSSGSSEEKSEIRTGRVHLFKNGKRYQMTVMKPEGPVKSEVCLIGKVVACNEEDS